MKTTNIFEKEVSYFNNLKETKPVGTTSIKKVLEAKKCKHLIEEYRQTGKREIKTLLPCYTVSGIFSERKESGLIRHSGVVCIDVDQKDNMQVGNFNELKMLITKIPYVSYCGLSCGGKGYFILIPIEQVNKHREHYRAICDDFERCGIKVDRNCIDISRLRIASFDDKAYINEQAVIYSKMTGNESELHFRKNETIVCNTHGFDLENTNTKVERIIREIADRRIDITIDYHTWLEIGAAIANHFGSCGRKSYHDISRFHKDYDVQKTDDQYSACLNMRNFTIGTLFHYAKLNGLKM